MEKTGPVPLSGAGFKKHAAERLAPGWPDLLLITVLMFAGFAASSLAAARLNPQLVQSASTPHNAWFQADLSRVFENMTERRSNHYRTKVHPLFSLVSHPAVHLLKRAGLEPLQAVRIFTAILAGFWLAAMYVVIRLAGVSQPDAALFSLLAACSSSFLFWVAVPETFLIGSLSMLTVAGFVALAQRNRFSAPWYVGISALSLSMTVTNWMAGIFAALVNHPLRRTVRITLDAFMAVTLLWAVQKLAYPSAQFFLGDREELGYVFLEVAGGPLHKSAVFWFHSMVMPEISPAANPDTPFWPVLTIQQAAIGSSGPGGALASFLWFLLLILGALTAIRIRRGDKLVQVLGLTLAAQFLLHQVYGDETFLYSLHWLPFLIILVSLATLSSGRRVVLATALLLLVLAATNNTRQFLRAADILNRYPETTRSERQKLLSFIEKFPEADWPRGEGHILIAPTGSPLWAKGYHEPGGSFSPGFGSFGISIAVLEEEAELLKLSSNSVPLTDLRQRILPGGEVFTRTPLYEAVWRSAGPGIYHLHVEGLEAAGLRLAVRVSSAGPAGGPIGSLEWDGRTLVVNRRWQLAISPPPLQVFFQNEQKPVRLSGDRPASDIWEPDDGFAGSLLLLGPGPQQVQVTDTAPEYRAAASGGEAISARRNLLPEVTIPDRRFAECLAAQLFHLRAGIVEDQTRPGDPGNYPLQWLRDGAFSVVALARAGDLELARHLVWAFAEKDFFGGFGAEADAPGLALWALDEISARVGEPDFDQAVWPHVRRKAGTIEELLSATNPVVKPFAGPVVPEIRTRSYLDLATIARPAKDGLITGKMDHHQPVFYVNAVSYLGLERAAEMATRLGHPHLADRWRQHADKLRESWADALPTHPDRLNARTFIAGIWPSRIALGKAQGEYERLLSRRWEQRRGEDGSFPELPFWTYFELAEAHQWLLLGRPELTWKTLEWFWRHEASPGLYTWWEGRGEENTFHQWEDVRGWVRPAHITPHYWTAAEMLLLQLNMLAFETEEEGEPAIVIGAGIQEHWLGQPLKIGNLSMRAGKLGWEWDGSRVSVCWQGGAPPRFSLGPAFPAGVRIEVGGCPEIQGSGT